MTTAEMLTRLNSRSNNRWTPAQLYQFLNSAQDRLIIALDPLYLTEITRIEGVTGTAGEYDLGALSPEIFGSGNVDAVRFRTSGIYYTFMPFAEIKKLEIATWAPSDVSPYQYVFKNVLYLKQDATNPEVDIFYTRKPLEIESGVNSELDESLHEMIVTIAEGIGWQSDRNIPRANFAFVSAKIIIDTMNGRA